MSMTTVMERLTEATEAQVRLVEREERRRSDAERDAREKARWDRGYQSDLRRFTFASLLPGAPQLALAFERVVPPAFWSQDGRTTVIVACPCGHEPIVDEGVPKGCACERTYVYTGEHVRVAGSPGREAVPS